MQVREVGGPAAWRGPEIAGEPGWKYRFHGEPLDQLVSAARHFAARTTATDERRLTDISRDDVALPAIRPVCDAIKHELMNGSGFALIRGLPVGDLTMLENEILCWIIGLQLGIPIHQNPQGTLLVHVRDEGLDLNQPGVRSYETAARLEYHTDSSDIVGLYCIRPAMRGGTSTIVSSVAVHDAVVRARPDLAALLYEPWGHASVVGNTASWKPICVQNGGRLFSRYGRLYIETANQRNPAVAPLTSDQTATLDLYDSFANSPEYYLNTDFQPGDIQLLNNYVIMHARTDYVDWPEPEHARELLRLWLVVEEPFDLPAEFENSGIISRTVAFNR